MRRPQRRSIVSSSPKTKGPDWPKSRTNSSNKRRAPERADHCAQAQHPQDRTNRPLAGCHNGSQEQLLSIRPNTNGKQRGEGLKQTHQWSMSMKQHARMVRNPLGQRLSNHLEIFRRKKLNWVVENG